MLRRTLLLSLPLVAACTPAHKPAPQDSPPRSLPEPPAPAVLEVTNHDFWRWDHGPEGEDGSWGESQANRRVLTTSEGRYELRVLDGASTDGTSGRFGIVYTRSDGEPGWEAELDRPFVPAGSMVSTGDRIYATHHSAIATGASVSAIDMATSRVRWTTQLEGLGPIGHSKYHNETQIAVDERGLVIYGNESQGQYTEVLDPQTGKSRSLARIDPRFTGMQWEGKGPEAPFDFSRGPSELTVGDTRYVVTDPEDLEQPATLRRLEGHQTAWTTSLRSQGSCGKAAMRMIDEQLWVAHYCAISSGTDLTVVDAQSGEIVRTVAVRALGPIAHSEYFNEVELDEHHGHVVVRGREAAGRYIEVIDPATGLARVSAVFWD